MVKSRVKDLDKLLAKFMGEKVELVEQNTRLLTAPGEHYGSVMLALDAKIRHSNGDEERLDLVAKLLPANEMLRLAFDIYVTFKKEVLAYTEAIPALMLLQKEYGVPKDKYIDQLFPKCYGARVSTDENSNAVDDDGVLIFENLKSQGYITEDRLVGFDKEATELIVSDLARFHATTIALKQLRPEVFKEKILPCTVKNKGLEQLPEEVGKSFHNSIMEGAMEQQELEPYLQRLQKVVDYFAIHPFVNRPPPNEPWGTMAHSDYWTSNTMVLKNEKGKAMKNKIVDLQLCTYTTAVRDLIFFLFTSVINNVLNNHYEDFLRVYHDSFTSTLKDFELDLSPFSWEEFVKEVNEVGPNETYHILVMLKPICTEREKVKNSAEDFQDSDWSRKDLLGPQHRRKLRDTVLAFVERGWI
nr:unnamed protein product [Callosobruchus chinensis]